MFRRLLPVLALLLAAPAAAADVPVWINPPPRFELPRQELPQPTYDGGVREPDVVVSVPPVRQWRPPAVNPQAVAAQRVRTMWAIPVPLDRDPGFSVTYELVLDPAGGLVVPPRVLDATHSYGSPVEVAEAVQSAYRAIVDVGVFPELAGQPGPVVLVLRP